MNDASGAAPSVASNEGPEQLLTTGQVAEWLQIPADTVAWWRKRRRGPGFVTVGRHVRYRRTDVDAWLEQQRGL